MKPTPRETKEEKAAARRAIVADSQKADAMPKNISEIPKRHTIKPMTEEQIDAVLIMIMEGHTVTAISKIKGMPSVYQVNMLAGSSTTFANDLTRARELGAATMADKIIDIADSIALDSASNARNKLRVDTRIRVASWYNKKFSDKLSAEDVGTVIAATITAARNRSDNSKRKSLKSK